MPRNLSREEQMHGSRRMILWGLAVAAVLGCGITLLSYFFSVSPGQSTADATGPRSFQKQGESIAGLTTRPCPGSTESFGGRGRAQEIISTETQDVNLSPSQFEAINRYFRQHADQPSSQINFTIAIGTAVPRQQVLNEWPQVLSDSLPRYRGHQYLLADHRLVVVEKETRRVIAIIPIAA